METVRIVARRRDQAGKGFARRLRMQEQLPAILYGNGMSVTIAFAEKDLVRIQQSGAGENTIVELAIEGENPETCQAILRELQIHPLHRNPLHADFYRVDMAKSITVTVPLEFINIPQEHLKIANAALHPLRYEIEVACLPGDIPEVIAVDVQGLQVGTALKASDIALPPGITLVTEAEESIVTTTDTTEAEAEA